MQTRRPYLTAALSESQNPTLHPFATSRALVRSRRRKWDSALEHPERAIGIQPSVISFIAKSVAHVGEVERHKAYRTCDIAFERFHPPHVTFLLLIKAIIVFIPGEHLDAISCADDLIAVVSFNPIRYMVQAHVHLLFGSSQMEYGDHEGAVQSFEHARAQMQDYVGPLLFAISLVSFSMDVYLYRGLII
ncbi:hypothetical protein EV363DRAFT_1438062 [Boletus edulis]|nr:hypothetical protein EV363DRAFT_1441165 [Boletus edulis]KAF8121029.1 hypothetical protein EV363DRAFT_1438062 [Boletus edulis]